MKSSEILTQWLAALPVLEVSNVALLVRARNSWFGKNHSPFAEMLGSSHRRSKLPTPSRLKTRR
jgi:hypothetical protein